MEKSLQQENNNLHQKIKLLQEELDSFKGNAQLLPIVGNEKVQNDSTQTDEKNSSLSIDYSPIHTCESLKSESITFDVQVQSPIHRVTAESKTQQQGLKPLELQQNGSIKQFPTQPNVRFTQNQTGPLSDITESNLTSQLQPKELYLEEMGLKKSIDQSKLKKSIQLAYTHNNEQSEKRVRNFYNSAIKQKSHCEQCISRMHQLHEMEFLKNKYHREYISLRAELDRVKNKSEMYQCQNHTPRSSLNLLEMYGQPFNNEEKSEKSSFSFENIENTLLSERFALEMQECLKLIDKLLVLDKRQIQLSNGDCKLLGDFQCKVEKLKYHLGLETEPKFLEQLFGQLQKSQLTMKKVHQKYRKLIEKIYKAFRENMKRSKDEFHQVNEVLVMTLNDLKETKMKNEKLLKEMDSLKANDAKEMKGQLALSSSCHDFNGKQLRGSVDSIYSDLVGLTAKQKELHVTMNLDQHQTAEKSSVCSLSEAKSQKQMEKLLQKIKTLERQNRSLQKTIKQMKGQMLGMKKKALNDVSQFVNAMIVNTEERKRNAAVQVQDLISPKQESILNCNWTSGEGNQRQPHPLTSRTFSFTSQQVSSNSFLSEICSLIYEIYSFTALQPDQDSSMFQPETEEEVLSMLGHIKQFTSKFDLWQKDKEREMNEFQKNFLQLLKFFIRRYKISQNQLLEEIAQINDVEPLSEFIKKYYSKSIQIDDHRERYSSEYTFGQKSESCKDSEVEP